MVVVVVVVVAKVSIALARTAAERRRHASAFQHVAPHAQAQHGQHHRRLHCRLMWVVVVLA
jgi:hypothetical protein